MGAINPTYNNRVRYTLQHVEHGSEVIAEPIGWRTDGKEFVRNKKYHGIFTKFSNSLKFIENGRDFIDEVYSLYGINAEIRLIRDEKHPHTDVWERSYDGYLDLSTYSKEDGKVSVKFNSSGLEQTLKSRESEKVEIERLDSIDGDVLEEMPTNIIEYKGREIFLQSTFKERKNEDDRIAYTVVNSKGGNFYTASTPFPMEILSNSDPERVHNPQSTQIEGDLTAAHIFYGHNDRTKILRLSINISATISVVDYVKVRDNNQFIKLNLTIYKDGSDYVPKTNIVLYEDPSPTSQQNRSFSVNRVFNIELLEGESIMIYFHTGARTGFNNQNGYFNHSFDCSGSVTIEEDSFFEKTSGKFVLAHELGQRLTQIVTGRNDAFYSTAFGRKELGYSEDGVYSLTGFTHGHWVRGFDKSDEVVEDDRAKYLPFKTSFKDYTNSMSAIYNMGLGIEKIGYKERLVFEDLKYFYQTFVGLKLPHKVKKLKRSVAKEYYNSSLVFGYEKGWENEEAMGLDEYNSQSNFTTIITRLKNKYNKLSKYIGASYAKEFIRRKPKLEYPTEDHRNDKEIFLLDLKKSAFGYEERVWQDDMEKTPTGVFSPDTATNLRLSPFNIMLRHGWMFACGFLKYSYDYVKFSSSEGNSSLKTQLKEGEEHSEKGNIINSKFSKPRFVPEWIEFEHEVDFEINQLINGVTSVNGRNIPNMYGLIEFKNEDNKTERGYLFSLKPNGEGKWKILKANI